MMNLESFSKHYNIVTQESVNVLYDVEIEQESVDSITDFDDIVNGYSQRDELLWKDEPIQYFIYDNESTEIFQTTDQKELIQKIKELAVKLSHN